MLWTVVPRSERAEESVMITCNAVRKALAEEEAGVFTAPVADEDLREILEAHHEWLESGG